MLGACESTTAPDNGTQEIAVGAVISGSLAAGDSGRAYMFPAAADSSYVIFAAVLEGALHLTVLDSAREHAFASAVATPTGRPLAESALLQFTAPVTGTHVLAVRGYPTGAAARFQLLIAFVDDAPENLPLTFAIGDTVDGETLDPGDTDVFTARLSSGQDIVLVVEAPDVTGLGLLAASVGDSAGTRAFASAWFSTGAPATISTGRFSLPDPGAYRFRFVAAPPSAPTPPPFHGPYRFWTYGIDPAPEHRAAAVPFSTVIAGETLDRAGDVDVFTFTAAAGDELNAFYQSAVTSHLEITPAAGAPLALVESGPDTALFSRHTGRLALQAGAYLARVSADARALGDTGAYRLFLYRIDRRPESLPAALVPGDSIAGEAIDLPGDVDEFTFTASAGEEFNAFVRAEPGTPPTLLRAVDADTTVLATAVTSEGDTSVLGQGSPRFAMRTTGTHRLRVESAEQSGTGRYRLFLARVNRKPEAAPDTLALGDSLFTEAIDTRGDVDEYLVHVTDSSGVNLVAALEGGASAGHFLLAQVVDSASGEALAGASSTGPPGQSGAVPLAPGSYVIRVQESWYWNEQPVLRAGYRLWLYGFRYGPESARDTIAIGDTVSIESLDVPGDVDRYHFYAAPRRPINLMLQGLSSGEGGFHAFLQTPSGGPLALVGTWLSSAALADHQTLRLDLPEAGWYTLTVEGGSWPTLLTEIGAYRLAVVGVDDRPEVAAASLAIGDSLTAEAVDFPGDLDQFLVAAPAGQELNVVFGTHAPCCRYPHVLVFDPATGDALAQTVGQNDRVAGPARVPGSGLVAIAVYEPPSVNFRECYDATCGGIFNFTGSYHLQVLLLDRAPETAPAMYTLGDTVRTEAIFPAGDIDEFLVTATPGTAMTPWYRLRADPAPAGSLITLEVIDPATGTVLVGSGISLYASSPSFFSPGGFTVPGSGHVLIRLRGSGIFGDDVGTAPYEFYVVAPG
jgi:hypothetical protein